MPLHQPRTDHLQIHVNGTERGVAGGEGLLLPSLDFLGT